MKVLFNCLPPANIECPSPALSALHNFLSQNNVESEIIYWNIELWGTMAYYSFKNDVITPLLPFFAIHAENYNDPDANRKISMKLQSYQPYFKKKTDFYSQSIEEIKSRTLESLRERIAEIDLSEVDLIGISARFYQWLPGLILIKEIRKVKPEIKVVIGGFGDKDSARYMLKEFPEFDYAVWGEGEYPLLELCNTIENGGIDFSGIQRLVYRSGNEVCSSVKSGNKLVDLNSGKIPEYDDYFEALSRKKISTDIIQLTLNTIKSCSWRACRFCTYHSGSRFREKKPELIVEEIRYLSAKHKVNRFYFADNELAGSSVERLESLLDLLVDYRKNENPELSIFGIIIPDAKMDSNLFRKMKLAGLSHLYAGYEALTPGLLKKMGKRNTLSDNISFVRNSLRNEINPVAGIVLGIYGETVMDVAESVENLHLLRFILDKEKFYHRRYPLKLYRHSEFFRMMPGKERQMFCENLVTNYLPADFINENSRFNIFSYWKPVLDNDEEWRLFRKIESYYLENKFGYAVSCENDKLVITETINGSKYNKHIFESKVYLRILELSDDKVLSFDDLLSLLNKDFGEVTALVLNEMLQDLAMRKLLFCNEDKTEIISVLYPFIHDIYHNKTLD